jgi:chromosome partitioning protein
LAAPDAASEHVSGDDDSAPAADEVRAAVEPAPVEGSPVEGESEPSETDAETAAGAETGAESVAEADAGSEIAVEPETDSASDVDSETDPGSETEAAVTETEAAVTEPMSEVETDIETEAGAEPEDGDAQATTGTPEDRPVVAATTLGDVVLPLPRVIAIANQKGGVGKTTTAVNLGAALAEAGYRTLVVDLDPQGNASTGLGVSPRDVETSVYDVIMTDAPALDCVEPTSLKNLFVLPATIDLAGAEIELVAVFSRELKLRRALDAVRVEYDVILIDCPPSLGLLTVNGLAAADDVIVPVQCEYYALEGLGQLLKNVAMIRSVNPTLDVRGIVLTMHDARTKLAEQVESEVREHFGAKVYKTVVPRTVRLSEAPSFGQPIIVFDPTSRGASAYRELAKEVSGGATRRTG